MSRFKKLSHTIYECKYHVVFCPKYRYRIFKGEIWEYTKQQVYVFRGEHPLKNKVICRRCQPYSVGFFNLMGSSCKLEPAENGLIGILKGIFLSEFLT